MYPKATTIQLGHGSGGEMTGALLEQYIFSRFKNPYIQAKHDGALLNLNGACALSTDSFVINPIFFKGGNIGELAVNGTVNDVAMCGALPQYLTLSFIIEEGLLLSQFEEIVKSVAETAHRCGIHIVTGDTKVVEKGKGDKIFINTTGIGLLHPKAQIDANRIEHGDVILVNDCIARHGMAVMSQREGLEFETAIKSDTTHLHFVVKALLDELGDDIKLFRDPTRGGIASVLNEIAQHTRLGVEIEENLLPVEKQVAAACEMLGLDPVYVANEGVFITVLKADKADLALQIMKKENPATQPVCIGNFVEQHPGKVVMQSLMGGKRIVSPLIGEQLPRIC